VNEALGLARWPNRPATLADTDAIFRLVADCEHDLDGQVEVDLDDIVADLSRPALDLGLDTVVVPDPDQPDGRLAGYAVVYKAHRAEVDVHPSRRGHGLGQALLAWTEARAAAIGSDRISQTVTDNNHGAAALFLAHGYRAKDTAWILEIAMDTPPVPPAAPEGITVRTFRPGLDDQAVYQVVEAAFSEWPDRSPVTFEEWRQLVAGRDTFAPALSPIALAGDRVVGVVLSLDYGDANEGYVHQVAVDRAYRGRGIARTLLRHAFAGFYRAGRRSCCLSTNSYTGALTLYQRVGMRIRRSYTRYEKGLAVR
jgi:mycothiol synthase